MFRYLTLTSESCTSYVQCCSLFTGRTDQVFPVRPVEPQESLQSFLLPEQQPGECSAVGSVSAKLSSAACHEAN